MSTPVQEIKEKLNIADLIGEYVRLQKRGTNYKGLCPFHNEKTPSFTVSEEKQFYHCFGCGKGGDLFQFIQDVEGVEFPEALRFLAQKAGVTLRAVNKKEENARTRLMDIVDKSATFFQEQLQTPAAAQAREYIKSRGLSDESLATFRIGYAPESWDMLIKHLQSLGFTPAEIQQSGMGVLGKNGSVYDRFRDRLMFPIDHTQGTVIGFTGRIITASASEAKYVNTPETPLYHKGSVLYGLSQSKTFIQKVGAVVLMEGQMDVVLSFQHSIRNVVASSGTALTAEQVKLLKRYTENIIIAFDGDAAGVAAAWKGMQIAIAEGMNIKVMALPVGEDPADIVNTDPNRLRELGKAAKPFMDYAFDQTLKDADLSQAIDKKRVAAQLLPMIALFPDLIEQTHYVNQLANILNVEEVILMEKIRASQQMNKPASGVIRRPQQVVQSAYAAPQEQEVSEITAIPLQGRIDQLLALLLQFPKYVPQAMKQFGEDLPLGSADSVALYKQLTSQYNHDDTQEPSSTSHLHIQDSATSYRSRIEMLSQESYAKLDVRQQEKEIETLLVSLKRHVVQSRLRILRQELVRAERENDLDTLTVLTTEVSELTRMLHNLS